MKKIVISFLNGCFSSEHSDLSFLPKEVTLGTDDFFLHISKNYKMISPIYFIFLNNAVCDLQNTILAEENSHVTLIQEYRSEMTCNMRNVIKTGQNSHVIFVEEYLSNAKQNYTTRVETEIQAEHGARVDYYKIQNESVTATHHANLIIQQKQDSNVSTFIVDRGSKAAKENIMINLNEAGAECVLNGLYLLNQNDQQLDHFIHVNHAAAHSNSSMLYKGILDNKSQAAFTGKVYVHPAAQQINAHQANHNLLLSKESRVSSKPELEIYADDVKCKHGATVGQLDDEAVFYLRSRGIEKQTAEKLLTHAFSVEMIDKIEQPMIKNYIQQQVGHHDEL
jgi:Fe-S cluster assembly protein SufD